MNLLFPLAQGVNAFSVTALLLVLGLAGRGELAADIGIGQAAVLLVFLACSGNARNMALADGASVSPALLLRSRVLLLAPLSALAYALCSAGGVPALLAACLIVRRAVEWIGELHLSERELAGDAACAGRIVLLQGALWLVVVGAVAAADRFAGIALAAWAVGPLLPSLRFVVASCRTTHGEAGLGWRALMPHWGSTAIIAVTVFVFRSLLVLVAGRAVAGELFAAFALGGLWPAVFASGLGPTLAHLESRGLGRRLGSVIWLVTAGCALAGLTVLALARWRTASLLEVHSSLEFWQAAGWSLAGGAVMQVAQRLRVDLLQKHAANLFGPDVLSNLLIVVSVPAVWSIGGRSALPLLYFWNAVLTLAFSIGAWCAVRPCRAFQRVGRVCLPAIAVLLVFPIFVQPGGGIFHHAGVLYDSQGVLSRLPIPLSAAACYAGLVLLAAYSQSYRTLSFVFASASLLLLMPLVALEGDPETLRPKMLLAVQMILPLPAIVLGEMFATRRRAQRWLVTAALATVAVIVPAQLVVSWSRGSAMLHSDLGVFSVYQHLQYVPVIIASLYLLALFSRFDVRRERRILMLLAPAVGAYVVASGSLLGVGLTLAGAGAFLVWHLAQRRDHVAAVVLAMLVVTASTVYLGWGGSRSALLQVKFGFARELFGWKPVTGSGSESEFATFQLPQNVADRLECWSYYVGEILSGTGTAWTGHDTPPPRERFASAHNFYLDMAYNFGLPQALLFVLLAVCTALVMLRNRRRLMDAPDLFGLALIVAVLVFLDNSLKVGFRQPYPGIISYLLWGLLLGRLRIPEPKRVALRIAVVEDDDEDEEQQPRVLKFPRRLARAA